MVNELLLRGGWPPFPPEIEILTSKAAFARVIDALRLGSQWSHRFDEQPSMPELSLRLRSMVQAVLSEESRRNLITVRVVSPDPQESMAIANEIASTYQSLRNDQFARRLPGERSQLLVGLVQPARLPTRPAFPTRLLAGIAMIDGWLSLRLTAKRFKTSPVPKRTCD